MRVLMEIPPKWHPDMMDLFVSFCGNIKERCEYSNVKFLLNKDSLRAEISLQEEWILKIKIFDEDITIDDGCLGEIQGINFKEKPNYDKIKEEILKLF